jgi:hypothetical protein
MGTHLLKISEVKLRGSIIDYRNPLCLRISCNRYSVMYLKSRPSFEFIRSMYAFSSLIPRSRESKLLFPVANMIEYSITVTSVSYLGKNSRYSGMSL